MQINKNVDDLLRQEVTDIESISNAKSSNLESLFALMKTSDEVMNQLEEEFANDIVDEVLINTVMRKEAIEESYKKGEITIEQANKFLQVYENAMKEQKRKLFGFISYQLKHTTLRKKDMLMMLAHGYNSTKFEIPLSKEEVEKTVNDALEKSMIPSYIDEKGEIIPYELARLILQCHHITSDGKQVYKYNGIHYEIVDDEFYFEIDKYIENKKLFNKFLRTAVLDHIVNMARNNIDTNSKYINFKNGLYNVETRSLEPHTYNNFSLGTYNASYDPTKSDISGTAWEFYLKTTLEESLIPTIQEMMGLCLYPLTKKIQTCFWLTGSGSNGKSILLDTISQIIPGHLTSILSMGDYDKRFINYSIKGKQVNIQRDDNTSHLSEIGNLKKITSGEPIFVERKGFDGEEIETNITHISSFNKMPSVDEKSEAFFRRLIIIPFEKSFGTHEQVKNGERDYIGNPMLGEEIKKELDIIVAWAIEGLLRVIDNGYKVTQPEATKQAKAEYTENSDLVVKWVKECIVKHSELPNKECLKATYLYKAYVSWCENERYNVLGRRAFDERIKVLLKKQAHSYLRNTVYKVSFKGFNRNE